MHTSTLAFVDAESAVVCWELPVDKRVESRSLQ